MRVLLPLVLVLLVSACSTTPEAMPEATEVAEIWPAPVGAVELQHVDRAVKGGLEDTALDVGLAIFDSGLPEDVTSQGTRGIFPVIRKAEARYLPVLLRQALMSSNAWGVVRVLPEPDDAAELQLSATILHSDGQRLALRVIAKDASGRLWLDRIYTDIANESDYPAAEGKDPFADLYRQIANDLLAQRGSFSDEEIQELRQTAVLRYAASLAPEAFGSYLGATSEGQYQILRLPAEGDPMLQRVERIRNQEHLFIDTVDEQYVDLFDEMRPTYNLWRQYGREQAVYIEEYQQRLAGRDSAGRRGSFAALQQTYSAFKWSKIQQQDLQELAQGFNNEVTPTVLEASGRVFRLNGSLESQYDEWRGILRQIFALETGLTPGDGAP